MIGDRFRAPETAPTAAPDIVILDRRVISTITGEIICDCGPRNPDPATAQESAREALRGTVLGDGGPITRDLPASYHEFEPYWCPHSAGDMWACKNCNYGLERTDGRPVRVATEAQRRAMRSRSDIDWYYTGSPVLWFGLDTEGRDWIMERNGKIARAYSQRQRQDAVKLAGEFGISAAARKTGIPRSTLKNWVPRSKSDSVDT